MSGKKVGRRGKYEDWLTEDGLLKVQGWARDGLSNEQIAHNIGINKDTLYEWQKRFSDFSDALKKGKEVVDREVENALLKRAMGYETVEEVEEPVEDKETGEVQMRVTKRVKKQVAPDVTAQIFWLKNRKPEEFRDKRDVELSGHVDLGSIIEKARRRVDE
jgi:transposase